MDGDRRKELWEAMDRNLRIEQFIEDFVKELKGVAKSNKDSYIIKTLRKILEEKKILEGVYE